MPAPKTTAAPGFVAEVALGSDAATSRLAVRIAPVLGAGDVVLLEGQIGSGKTFFARSLIAAKQASAGLPSEDVPSPTFTLVQTYAAGPLEIWHADLYRLSNPSEVAELGLEDAFDTALCLVEWPDRLGRHWPDEALQINFTTCEAPQARRLTLRGSDSWAARLAPALEGFHG